MNKLDRIACLYLTFLGNPGGLTFAKLREYLPEAYPVGPDEDPESVRRKFERDKDELRALGLDLRYYAAGEALPDGSAAPHSMYVLAEELQQSPEIELSRSELRTLASLLMSAISHSDTNAPAGDAGQALLESAAFKLLYRYPALYHNREGMAIVPPRESREESSIISERLAVIHEGLARRRTLEILYRDKTGQAAARRVDGRGLISHRGRWCLVAHCHRAKDIRMFYVDRIESAQLSEQEYAPARNFDLKQYSLHPLALYIEPEVQVRLELDAEREENLTDFLSGLPGRAAVHIESAGAITQVHFKTSNPGALFGWMMRHPGAVLRLGPPELHARFVAYVETLKQNYTEAPA